MLSHGGIINNCEGAYNLLKTFISKKPKFLTWLPLSHSYEHTVQFVQIVVSAKVFYAESIEKLIKNMKITFIVILMNADGILKEINKEANLKNDQIEPLEIHF